METHQEHMLYLLHGRLLKLIQQLLRLAQVARIEQVGALGDVVLLHHRRRPLHADLILLV